MNILKKIVLKIGYNWLFLIISIAIFFGIYIFNPAMGIASSNRFVGLLMNIAPILAVVFGFMFILNIILNNKILLKYLGHGSGIKGWIIAIAGGIISHGPIYLWYPLLADLKEKGMKISLIAVFLYNRAVKIPLIPMMIFYFGWGFFIVLTVYMIIFSVINGLIVGRIMEKTERG